MIVDLIVALGGSFAISILLVPFLRAWARKRNFLDQADGNPLKVHQGAIPRIGGLGIIIATCLAFYLSFYLRFEGVIPEDYRGQFYLWEAEVFKEVWEDSITQ